MPRQPPNQGRNHWSHLKECSHPMNTRQEVLGERSGDQRHQYQPTAGWAHLSWPTQHPFLSWCGGVGIDRTLCDILQALDHGDLDLE